MGVTLLRFLLLSLPLMLLIPSWSAQCNPDDRSALLQMKADYGNPTSLSDWNSNSTDCCHWTGITCFGTDRVTYFTFFYANLSGPISPAIARLTSLTFLRFYVNSITGPIPAILAQLTNLLYLDLARNKLSGPVPAFLAKLPLITLTLNNNRFTGTIPASLGLSSTLQYVNLQDNKLTGDASVLFGASRPIHVLLLARNRFVFNLSAVTFPVNLTALDIHHNMVYGGIPKQINELKNLGYLNVSYNQLCGEIPITGRVGRIPQLKEWSFAHNKCLCGSPLPACF